MDIEAANMLQSDEDIMEESGPNAMPCNPCVKYQAPCAAFLRPAQWIPFIRNCHRSEKKWRFTFPNTEEHLIILREALEANDCIIYQQKTTMYGFLLQAYSFTNVCGWLDVITLEVHLNERNSSEVSVKATAGSTGFLPLVIPLSPVLNILLCWVPFYDNGNNNRYLNNIWKKIHEQV